MHEANIERKTQQASKLTDLEIEKITDRLMSSVNKLYEVSYKSMQSLDLVRKCQKDISKLGKLMILRSDGDRFEPIFTELVNSKHNKVKLEAGKWFNKYAKKKGYLHYQFLLDQKNSKEIDDIEDIKEEKILCPTCGLTVPPYAKFCGHCGAKL